MSDFVARMVTRTTGATGLQPRIAPITAPEPWHEPLDLELAAIERTAVPSDEHVPSRPSPKAAPRRDRTAMPSMDEEIPARATEPVDEPSLSVDESRRAPDPDRPMADSSARVASPRRSATESVRVEAAPSGFVEITDEHEFASESPRARVHGVHGPSRAAAVPSLRARVPDLGRRELSTREVSSGEPSIVELEREVEREQPEPSSDSNPTTAPEHARHSSATVGTPSRRAMLDPTGLDPTGDVPRPPRRRESAREGIVRVEIGRVELRAAPSREPVDVGVPKPETFVSLKQYLRERGGK